MFSPIVAAQVAKARPFESLSPAAVSAMCRLFLGGPLHDNRAGRMSAGVAELVSAGLARHDEPWSYLNVAGVAIAGTAKVEDKQWLYKQAGC